VNALEARIAAFGEVVSGAQDTMALLTVFELGVFTALWRSPQTAHELGDALGVNGHRLRAFLDRVAALGFLAKQTDRYSLVPGDEDLFDPEHDRARALGFASVEKTLGRCARAVEVLRSDTSMAVAGTGAQASVEERTRFLQYLHTRSEAIAAELAELLCQTPARRIVDLGCGLGTYAAAVLSLAPDATALLVDRDTAEPAVRAFLADRGLSTRARFQAGDFLTHDWGHGFDLALASNLVHNLGHKATVALLARTLERLAPGGRVVVKDLVVDDDRLAPTGATRFALMMALFTDRGGVFPASEVAGWMRELGYVEVGEVSLQTAPDAWVLVGHKA